MKSWIFKQKCEFNPKNLDSQNTFEKDPKTVIFDYKTLKFTQSFVLTQRTTRLPFTYLKITTISLP